MYGYKTCTRIFLNGDDIWMAPDYRILEKCFVESAILGFGIRNSAHVIWNPESQFHWQRLEPNAWIASLRGRRLKENEREGDYGRKFSSPSFRTPVKQASTVKPRLTATSLLRPLLLAAWRKPPYIFFQKRPSLIRPNFWPVGDRINGVPLYLESEIDGVESRIQGCIRFLSRF